MPGLSLSLARIGSIAALWLASVLVQADQTGKTLYSQHCAACHGDRGAGGVGVPLALESFQKTVSDDYLFKSFATAGQVV